MAPRPGERMDAAADAQARSRLTGILCGLASAFIWGAFPVVTRLGVAHTALDAWDVTFIRYATSGVILLPLLLRRGLMGLGARAIALMVLGLGAPYMLVVAAGLRMAPVEQFAAVTPASMIVFSACIGAWLSGARPPPRTIAGIGLIVAGIAMVGWQALFSGGSPPLAYLVFLAGGLLWAVYTVTSRRQAVAALHATAVVSVFSMLLYAPFYLALRGTRLLQVAPGDVAVQAAYQGVLVSIVALFFYNRSVQLLGSTTGTIFAALVPASAVVLASVLLGERPSALVVAGLLVVTAGMATALFARPAPPLSKRQPSPELFHDANRSATRSPS